MSADKLKQTIARAGASVREKLRVKPENIAPAPLMLLFQSFIFSMFGLSGGAYALIISAVVLHCYRWHALRAEPEEVRVMMPVVGLERLSFVGVSVEEAERALLQLKVYGIPAAKLPAPLVPPTRQRLEKERADVIALALGLKIQLDGALEDVRRTDEINAELRTERDQLKKELEHQRDPYARPRANLAAACAVCVVVAKSTGEELVQCTGRPGCSPPPFVTEILNQLIKDAGLHRHDP